MAGLDRVRPEAKVEDAIRTHLSTRNGILEVVVLVGVGIGMTPVYRVSNHVFCARAAASPYA